MRPENRGAVREHQEARVLKRDALGRIELVHTDEGPLVRRVACGGAVPGSRWIARVLLGRERRALARLGGLPGVAPLHARDGERDAATTLLRGWLAGRPLCLATELPRDYFERLEELVRDLHDRGVCHNDLHKEANVLVGDDGRPGLIDFQLASVHARRGRVFASRAREDLRHVWKHRSVYLAALGEPDPLAGASPRRSLVAALWRALKKPVYGPLKRLVRGARAEERDEPRRDAQGPWPRWRDPVGPRVSAAPGSSREDPARAR
jgi:hypothetical protein